MEDTALLEVKKNDRYKIGHFFKNITDTTILSCLQGHMGRAWTDNLESPTCALIQGGAFCFLAGDKNSPFIDEIISQILTLTDLGPAFVNGTGNVITSIIWHNNFSYRLKIHFNHFLILNG
jgi:hypothetical protein